MARAMVHCCALGALFSPDQLAQDEMTGVRERRVSGKFDNKAHPHLCCHRVPPQACMCHGTGRGGLSWTHLQPPNMHEPAQKARACSRSP